MVDLKFRKAKKNARPQSNHRAVACRLSPLWPRIRPLRSSCQMCDPAAPHQVACRLDALLNQNHKSSRHAKRRQGMAEKNERKREKQQKTKVREPNFALGCKNVQVPKRVAYVGRAGRTPGAAFFTFAHLHALRHGRRKALAPCSPNTQYANSDASLQIGFRNLKARHAALPSAMPQLVRSRFALA